MWISGFRLVRFGISNITQEAHHTWHPVLSWAEEEAKRTIEQVLGNILRLMRQFKDEKLGVRSSAVLEKIIDKIIS
ncbi:Lipase 3 N-terminal region [Musa troglodytarum]|nr:Lipase 3 N-terminal region [Musa troglodytarum]